MNRYRYSHKRQIGGLALTCTHVGPIGDEEVIVPRVHAHLLRAAELAVFAADSTEFRKQGAIPQAVHADLVRAIIGDRHHTAVLADGYSAIPTVVSEGHRAYVSPTEAGFSLFG